MSNEKQEEKVTTYVGSKGCDVGVVYAWDVKDGIAFPVLIAPLSDRAKQAFRIWGWDGESSGIAPPVDAMDFIKLLPAHWTMESLDMQEGSNLIQEITLPESRLVLH